jgi:hypothetical protein
MMIVASAAAASATPRNFQTLPTDVASHLTSMMSMRDFLHLRGVEKDLYNRVVFRGKHMACLKQLKPGMLTWWSQQQPKVSLVYLGLHLQFPPTQAELDALGELRSLTSLKSLEITFETRWMESRAANAAWEDMESRVAATWEDTREDARHVLPAALALNLESLSFQGPYIGQDMMFQVLVPCVLANRNTLKHLALTVMERSASSHTSVPDEFARTLLGLTSLRLHGNIQGGTSRQAVVYHQDNASAANLRFLSLLSSGLSLFRNQLLPMVLPSTLEGLVVASDRHDKWTCPPNVRFLRVTSRSDLSPIFVSHIPPNHAALQQLSIVTSYPYHQEDVVANLAAYEEWLQHITLPCLETLAVNVDYYRRHATVQTISMLVKKLPHLKLIYLDTVSLGQYHGELERFYQRIVSELDVPSHVNIITGPLPDLEAPFLLAHDLSMMSPCS